ncbi:MAG TPA: zf-HC2 domain-containing protein [Vicinamibacterales bacterium]
MAGHISEDDLTLYYYGEGRRRAEIERHLDTCRECAAVYREIAGTLAMIMAPEVPERGDQYGLEVWQRIRQRLAEREEGFSWFRRFWGFSGFQGFSAFFGFEKFGMFAAGAAAAVLLIAAFVAGRMWQTTSTVPAVATTVAPTAPPTISAGAGKSNAGQRILLTAVADHLDRSERVLTDIMNSHEPADISSEQRWAEDLITTSRLYRQDAVDAGEQSVASVLDDLERNLLEIVHSPAKISAADLEQIRRRIDAAALLFKVRVMSDELRQREAAPQDRPATRKASSTIS